jgi:O-antigen ligase
VAFGAVYQWALVPLTIGAVGVGVFSILRLAPETRARLPTVFAPLAIAVALQIVPLPKALVARVSPATARVATHYDPAFAQHGTQALSVASENSIRALLLLMALGCLAWGVASTLSSYRVGPTLARNVAVLATAIGVLAVVQKATFNGKIYWFWDSQFQYAPNYYGPFVNRNHFAGWMILAIGLTGGYLCGLVETAARAYPSTPRERVLWLSTPTAAKTGMLFAALATMCVALVWSMSRSGIAGAVVALLVLLVCASRRLSGVLLATAVVILATAGAGALAWKGPSQLVEWYATTGTFEWRVQLWRDSLAMLRDFWLTGSGLNTYGVLTLIYPMSDTTVHAVQAHNDYLQLAVEGGLLVGIPAVIAITALIRTIVRRLRTPQDERTWWIRLGAAAAICGIAVQEITDFSLQIPGVALLFAVVIAIAIHEPSEPLVRHRHAAGIPTSPLE